MKKIIILIIVINFCLLGFYLFNVIINYNTPTIKKDAVVVIKPKPISKKVIKKLPAGEKATIQLDIPAPPKVIGKKITQHVVVTEKGNTLAVNVENIDWGFRCTPKIHLGYSYDKNLILDTFAGVGVSWFKWHRLNTDTFLYYNFYNKNIGIGVGISYQIYNNTFVGINYNGIFDPTQNLSASISLNF